MQLMEMKQQIEEKKNERILTEGRLEQLNKELLDDWGCENLEQAEKKLEKMQTQLAKSEIRFDKNKKALEENYDWD